jgi:hypothetical protein
VQPEELRTSVPWRTPDEEGKREWVSKRRMVGVEAPIAPETVRKKGEVRNNNILGHQKCHAKAPRRKE